MELSIVVPHRASSRDVASQLPALIAAAEACARRVELIFVDGGESTDEPPPAPPTAGARLRWLKLERASAGLAAAINAGLTAARGEHLLVVELGEQYPTDQWRGALAALDRYDAVFGRRAACDRRLATGTVRGIDRASDPDCLLWALRRETAGRLRLPRGMQPYAAELLAWQGRRCAELVVDHRLPWPAPRWPDAQPDLITWLAWRWLARRPPRLEAREIDPHRPLAARTTSGAMTKPGQGSPAPASARSRRATPPTRPSRPALALDTAQRPLRVFFSVGEPSGDVHGANLIDALRRRYGQVEALGFAGPRMREAGCRGLADFTQLAVMWFAAAFVHLSTFLRMLVVADRTLRATRPDAVVLIDFPGFNWHVARRAKAQGIPVFYYSPPQVWAWASWRIRKMRRLVDHVLSGLPFETEWLNAQGCKAHYMGHPFFDEVRSRPHDEAFVAQLRAAEGPLVALLPGSRTQEVERNFPQFLKVVRRVREQAPGARFAVAAYRQAHAERARQMIAAAGLPIEVYVGRTPELIQSADCCLAVSGSVSLELLHHAKPTVVLYQIGRAAYWVQNRFRRVKYITLVNLLAGGELHPRDTRPYDPRRSDAPSVLFPEYLTWQDRSAEITGHLVRWLTDAAEREALVARLAALRARVGRPGAADTAAEYIGQAVAARRGGPPAPHFTPHQVTGSGYRYEAA